MKWIMEKKIEDFDYGEVERRVLGDLSFAYQDELTPIERYGDVWLKRDDLYRAAGAPGGKARTCWHLAQEAKGLVAASHRLSPQMHMVARVAAALKIPCRIHTAEGESDQIEDAKFWGAKFVRHTPGYNNVLIHRAKLDAFERGWREIPFGMESQQAVNLTAAQVRKLPKDIKRVVVCVGMGISLSGVVKGLDQQKFPVPILAVEVGTKNPSRFIEKWAPKGWKDRVTLVRSPHEYHDLIHAKIGGVLLDPVYEAKCVEYMQPGDLLWVIGIRASLANK